MKRVAIVLAILLFGLSGGAFAYDFWGITMGTELYNGAQQLAFTAPGTDIQYQVGAYQYTKVGSTWYGSFAPASPGSAYPQLQRKCDAMGLFFTSTAEAACFKIITGMPETGVTAPEVGYGAREFGPGDLMIRSGLDTYGIGLRAGGLLWAVDPASTAAWYQIYNADGSLASMYARDAGNLGSVALNPNWAHVDNHPLAALPNDPRAFGFYIAGTGTSVGSATSVGSEATGVFLDGVQLFSYDVVVPWELIGIDSSDDFFEASWRPDCGNDLISARFKPDIPDVPEPYSVVLAVTGLAAVAGYRRKRA